MGHCHWLSRQHTAPHPTSHITHHNSNELLIFSAVRCNPRGMFVHQTRLCHDPANGWRVSHPKHLNYNSLLSKHSLPATILTLKPRRLASEILDIPGHSFLCHHLLFKILKLQVTHSKHSSHWLKVSGIYKANLQVSWLSSALKIIKYSLQFLVSSSGICPPDCPSLPPVTITW